MDEAPNNLTSLGKNYKIISYARDNNSLITLYNAQEFDYSEELTGQLNTIKLTAGLQDRILITVFVNKETLAPVLIVNVHANFGKSIIEDVQKLSIKARQLGINDIIYNGDQNRNLTRYDVKDRAKSDISTGNEILSACQLSANNIENSSFIRRFIQDTQLPENQLPNESHIYPAEIETRDGAITSHTVTLKPQIGMYLVSPFNPEYDYLDASLIRIPAEFINNIGHISEPKELQLKIV